MRDVASRPRIRRLADLSSANPIGWRPCADPVQKQVPGEWMTQKGIDLSRPVTEGPHFGLTPRKYQSGETDYTGRISKIGDAAVREALYQAAHVMLTKPVKGCSELKGWAMRIARRAGHNKAKVALARKLAVIMHRMLADNAPFNPTTKAKTMAAA